MSGKPDSESHTYRYLIRFSAMYSMYTWQWHIIIQWREIALWRITQSTHNTTHNIQCIPHCKTYSAFTQNEKMKQCELISDQWCKEICWMTDEQVKENKEWRGLIYHQMYTTIVTHEWLKHKNLWKFEFNNYWKN